MIIAVLYLLGIIAAEVITVFLNAQAGIISHVLLLAALIFHSSLSATHPSHRLLLSLALAPLIRILSLSMPLTQVSQIYWYPIIYVPLLVATVVVMRNLSFGAREVGLTISKPRVQILVALTGLVFGVMEYLILRPEPLVSELSWAKAWSPALVLMFSTGFVEELIFRGVLQRASAEALGRWGILYVSVLFSMLHIGFLSAIDVLFVSCIAMFFALIVKKTGSLLGVSLSHGITNITLYLVIPFLI